MHACMYARMHACVYVYMCICRYARHTLSLSHTLFGRACKWHTHTPIHAHTYTHRSTLTNHNSPRKKCTSLLSSPHFLSSLPPPSFHTPHYHTPHQRISHIFSERAHGTTRSRGSVSLICAAANGGATDGKSEMVPDTIRGMPLNLHSVSTRQYTLYTHTHTHNLHTYTHSHTSARQKTTRGGVKVVERVEVRVDVHLGGGCLWK